METSNMNVTVDFALNKKFFYQQKQLLIELRCALSKKYESDELTAMMEGILQIFDAIGDAAEAQKEFIYPKYDSKTGKFVDDTYNNVFEKLTGHNVHELESDNMKSYTDNPSNIKIQKRFLTQKDIQAAEQCLVDNGIYVDEVDTVLQALCYTLFDTEIEV